MLDLRRREFITLLGGEAAAWPLAARAQQIPRDRVSHARIFASWLHLVGVNVSTKAAKAATSAIG